jgi:hypothetical protein
MWELDSPYNQIEESKGGEETKLWALDSPNKQMWELYSQTTKLWALEPPNKQTNKPIVSTIWLTQQPNKLNQTKPNKTKSRQLKEPKRTKPNKPRQVEPKQSETNIGEQPINQTQTQRHMKTKRTNNPTNRGLEINQKRRLTQHKTETKRTNITNLRPRTQTNQKTPKQWIIDAIIKQYENPPNNIQLGGFETITTIWPIDNRTQNYNGINRLKSNIDHFIYSA